MSHAGIYLNRYLGGKCADVWAELTALGPAIRQEPLYHDAAAVARETMRRACQNVELIIKRLKEIGYDFSAGGAGHPRLPPTPESIATLNSIEESYGQLPLSIRMWYEEVGSVSLIGAHPKLSHYAGRSDPDITPHSDPLYMDYLIEPDEYCTEDEEYDRLLGNPPRYLLALWPDLTLKANYSGGGPAAILLPNFGMDGILLSEDWAGFTFYNYLRLSFQWGGLAALSLQPEAAIAAKEEIAFLTKDLLII